MNDEKPTETPWWQQMRRHPPSAPSHSAEPQAAPYQQPAYPPAQQGQGQYYPQYAQPPGQHGQPADGPTHSKRWLLIAAGVLFGALVAVAVAVGLLAFGAFDRQVLDVTKAQEGVKHVVTDPTTGYGVENVTDVKCNGGENPSAKKGDTFTCQVTVDGKQRKVNAVFVDDNGTYEVDRPR
jgi:hypothetical protein